MPGEDGAEASGIAFPAREAERKARSRAWTNRRQRGYRRRESMKCCAVRKSRSGPAPGVTVERRGEQSLAKAGAHELG
eukprot:11277383-Heterocapsa_arctica.AAC.1